MPIKIISAPGDHRDDFAMVETQVNDWIEHAAPKVLSITPVVNPLPEKRDASTFMMTVLIHYE
ncbi:MAG: hypothetical protein D6744_11780 [Planctomycetota bacterium]|nr:MAG: hypothetical protein D6744_11780 [Planctomycetota bacterium]